MFSSGISDMRLKYPTSCDAYQFEKDGSHALSNDSTRFSSQNPDVSASFKSLDYVPNNKTSADVIISLNLGKVDALRSGRHHLVRGTDTVTVTAQLEAGP